MADEQTQRQINDLNVLLEVSKQLGGTTELIPLLEQRTGVPVISSMPHGLWAGARLVGLSGAAPGYGTLLSMGSA